MNDGLHLPPNEGRHPWNITDGETKFRDLEAPTTFSSGVAGGSECCLGPTLLQVSAYALELGPCAAWQSDGYIYYVVVRRGITRFGVVQVRQWV